MRNIGFIGCGNMGTAILNGILKAELVEAKNIYVHTATPLKREQLAEKYHICAVDSNKAVAEKADLILLAVKPYLFDQVFEEIREALNEDKVLISVAAGQSLDNMAKLSTAETKIIRTMPNTPASVGEGMSAITPNANCTEKDIEETMAIFTSFGKAEIIPEHLMDAVPAVSGSSPAYIFMLINALCDGAVRDGMSRSMALTFAAQAVLGSAKMVLESGIHPEQLKDMVCSPNGTTIEAVAKLEEKGFRDAVLAGMKACTDRLKEMNS